MVDIAGARDEIQKVVAFLVSRHGSEKDVFNHLTLALDYLREDPVETAVAVPDLPSEDAIVDVPPIEETATAEPGLEVPEVDEVQEEEEPEVLPEAPKVRRQNRRRKGTRT